jgi:hypothetical protein
MRAGAQMGAMRDGDFLAKRDRAEVVNQRFLPYRSPIANGEIPRKINARRIVNMNMPPHLGAVATQNKTPPAKAWARAEAEHPLAEDPQNSPQHLLAGIFLCSTVGLNVKGHFKKAEIGKTESGNLNNKAEMLKTEMLK